MNGKEDKHPGRTEVPTGVWVTAVTFVITTVIGLVVAGFNAMSTTHDRIDRMENNFSERISANYNELRGEIRTVEQHLDGEDDESYEELRKDIRALHSEIRGDLRSLEAAIRERK